MDTPDHDSEVFRLAIAAGFYHPDPAARSQVRSQLDKWLTGLGPTPEPEAVHQAIALQKGTVIEPFILTAEDLECAIFLVRAAFSERGGQYRVRIVSRDTIGEDGGLVLTRKLQSYYVERYAHGMNRSQPGTGHVFLPTHVPSQAHAPGTATLLSEDNGFRVVVPYPDPITEKTAVLARKLQQGSGIAGAPESFDRLGLRVEIRNREIHVLSGSPESMIRLLAHLADRGTLVLQQSGESTDRPVFRIALDIPGEEPVSLRAMASATPVYTSWFHGQVSAPLFLEPAHQLMVSRWLRPSATWLDFVFENLS
jgi:hypothetical protein